MGAPQLKSGPGNVQIERSQTRRLSPTSTTCKPLIGKGMAWARAEDDVCAFIECTQLPFLASPMGKGVMPDDHPLSVAAARTLALQNADVVFLMGARFNWIFHPRFRGGRFRPGAALCQGHEGHPARHRARGQALARRSPPARGPGS